AARRPPLIDESKFADLQPIVKLHFRTINRHAVELCHIAAEQIDAPQSSLVPVQGAVKRRYLRAPQPQGALWSPTEHVQPGAETSLIFEQVAAIDVHHRQGRG